MSAPKAKRRRRRLNWTLALLLIGAVVVYTVVWFSRGPNLRAEGIASMTLSTYSPYYCGEDEDNMYGTVSFEVVEDYRRRAIIAVMNDSSSAFNGSWRWIGKRRISPSLTPFKFSSPGQVGVSRAEFS